MTYQTDHPFTIRRRVLSIALTAACNWPQPKTCGDIWSSMNHVQLRIVTLLPWQAS